MEKGRVRGRTCGRISTRGVDGCEGECEQVADKHERRDDKIGIEELNKRAIEMIDEQLEALDTLEQHAVESPAFRIGSLQEDLLPATGSGRGQAYTLWISFRARLYPMDELERVQRRWMGDLVPPTSNMNLDRKWWDYETKPISPLFVSRDKFVSRCKEQLALAEESVKRFPRNWSCRRAFSGTLAGPAASSASSSPQGEKEGEPESSKRVLRNEANKWFF